MSLITINTNNFDKQAASQDFLVNRKRAYSIYNSTELPLCSIFILAHNRLEKTKYCVECVLKYTTDINYELILVDNGSSDSTLEFFKSVEHPNKKIIHITKDLGIAYAFEIVRQNFTGKFFVQVSNDVYVTKNWMKNLLACYESDERIGMVVPASSNASGFQQVDLSFDTFEQMQARAEKYNISDSTKWEERARLVSIIFFLHRKVLDSVGFLDRAYLHDFLEDDLCIRIRRAGFKLMFCGDTWICHDHDFRNMDNKDPVEFQKSLENGRAIFKSKYQGIDAWDDMNNFELNLLAPVDKLSVSHDNISALVLEPKCGTPVLEIRNKLRKNGLVLQYANAFITQAKYFSDVQTAADFSVCDRMDFVQDHFANNSFDIVALCEPINTYRNPVALMQKLFDFLKPQGLLLFKIKNTDDVNTFLRLIGYSSNFDETTAQALSSKEVSECLKLIGAKNISITNEMMEPISDADKQSLLHIYKSVNPKMANENFKKSLITNFIFAVRK